MGHEINKFTLDQIRLDRSDLDLASRVLSYAQTGYYIPRLFFTPMVGTRNSSVCRQDKRKIF